MQEWRLLTAARADQLRFVLVRYAQMLQSRCFSPIYRNPPSHLGMEPVLAHYTLVHVLRLVDVWIRVHLRRLTLGLIKWRGY